MTPPAPSPANPAAAGPSHLQKVYAELATGLPVPGQRLPTGVTLAPLRTSADFAAFIDDRVAAWKATTD